MWEDDLNSMFGGIFGDAFGTKTPADYEKELTELYQSCKIERYYNLLNRLKSRGYAIMRNAKGQHRVRKE